MFHVEHFLFKFTKMEIVINSSKAKKSAKNPRKYILEENHAIIKEYLKAHNLPVSNSLEENCKNLAKNVALQKQRFDKQKKRGLTPAKFKNFVESDSYNEMFENFLNESDSGKGINFEENSHDYFEIQEGVNGTVKMPTAMLVDSIFDTSEAIDARNANFENFSLKDTFKGAQRKVEGTKIGGLIADSYKLPMAPAKSLLGIKTNYSTGLGGKLGEIQSGIGNQLLGKLTGGAVDMGSIGQLLGGKMTPSQEIATAYTQTPIVDSKPLFSTVRSNAIAEGADSWVTEEKRKALDELIKKGEKDKRDNEIKASLIKIGVSPSRFKNFENFDGNFSDKARDILSGIVEHEKAGETAKATLQAMPKIIFLVILALIIGYFVAKND